MKVIKKNVYYCDFCKKKSLRSLKKHELHCTGNPNRECGLCRATGIANDTSEIITKIKNIIEQGVGIEAIINEFDNNKLIGYKVNISIFDDIKHSIDWCPACVLATLRQCKISEFISDKKRTDDCLELCPQISGDIFHYRYDFKKDLSNYWNEINSNKYQNEYY